MNTEMQEVVKTVVYALSKKYVFNAVEAHVYIGEELKKQEKKKIGRPEKKQEMKEKSTEDESFVKLIESSTEPSKLSYTKLSSKKEKSKLKDEKVSDPVIVTLPVLSELEEKEKPETTETTMQRVMREQIEKMKMLPQKVVNEKKEKKEKPEKKVLEKVLAPVVEKLVEVEQVVVAPAIVTSNAAVDKAMQEMIEKSKLLCPPGAIKEKKTKKVVAKAVIEKVVVEAVVVEKVLEKVVVTSNEAVDKAMQEMIEKSKLLCPPGALKEKKTKKVVSKPVLETVVEKLVVVETVVEKIVVDAPVVEKLWVKVVVEEESGVEDEEIVVEPVAVAEVEEEDEVSMTEEEARMLDQYDTVFIRHEGTIYRKSKSGLIYSQYGPNEVLGVVDESGKVSLKSQRIEEELCTESESEGGNTVQMSDSEEEYSDNE